MVHSIIVAICTYHRNAELAHLLGRLEDFAGAYWQDLQIGVTVVDDSVDGQALSVVQKFKDKFQLGLRYTNSASRNISTARNAALEESMWRADWIAMTDDDCEPSEQWLTELANVQHATSADIVTGLMLRRAGDLAPAWIKTQPFLELGEFEADDGQELEVAFTNNCLISTSLLKESSVRFDVALGRVGGEDMAFFREITRSGARIAFAARAFIYENEPPERLTYRYQLRRYFWHGNSSVVTSIRAGKSSARMFVHGVATCIRALFRPLKRMISGETPQFAYGLAQIFEGLGKIIGAFGIKIEHK